MMILFKQYFGIGGLRSAPQGLVDDSSIAYPEPFGFGFSPDDGARMSRIVMERSLPPGYLVGRPTRGGRGMPSFRVAQPSATNQPNIAAATAVK